MNFAVTQNGENSWVS